MFSINMVLPSRNQKILREHALPSYTDVHSYIYRRFPIAVFKSKGSHCHLDFLLSPWKWPVKKVYHRMIFPSYEAPLIGQFLHVPATFPSRMFLPRLRKAGPAAQLAGSQGGRTTRHQPQQSFFHQGALENAATRVCHRGFPWFSIRDSISWDEIITKL